MKHYFFINPVAGKGNKSNELIEEINSVMTDYSDDYEILLTEPGRASERKARAIAENLNGEAARFYACGGDGTANEIASGIIGFNNVELGIIPIGSGNDMIRNFPDSGSFIDVRSQINGKSRQVDVMRFSGVVDGKERTGYCLNMFNIGFDCNVVVTALKLKNKKFITGEAAYSTSILLNFIKKRGARLDIYEGDETVKEGKVLLCAVSNESFCGGGIKSSPQALVDDGYFDLNIVNDVSRLEFLKLLPKYKEGTHLEVDGIESTIYVKKSKHLLIKPHDAEELKICIDGEPACTEGITVAICEKALSFIVPIDVN